MRSYSSFFRPSSAQGSSTSGVAAACLTVSRGVGVVEASCGDQLLEDRGEEGEAVGAAGPDQRLDGVLGVRHEADDVARPRW